MAPRKSKSAKEESPLLKALRFVAVTQNDMGTAYQTHCRILGKMVVAFDGILAAGHPVPDEMSICPHTNRLIAALEKVGGAYSLTALDNSHLSIKTDRFSVMVECAGMNDMPWVQPDAAAWPINDTWKEAATKAALFATVGAQTVMASAVVTRDGSIVGTNGHVVIEAWHGLSTPPGLVIPKAFVSAIEKITVPLVRFGFTQESLTFHFEDGSWLKTQLYQERYPNVDGILQQTTDASPVAVTAELWEAIQAVMPHTDGTAIFMGDGLVHSHKEATVGASFKCAEAVIPLVISAKYLLTLSPYIERVDYGSRKELLAFFGDKIRGAVAKMVA